MVEKVILGVLGIIVLSLVLMLFYLFILPFFVKFEDIEAKVKAKTYEKGRTEVTTVLINGTVMPTVRAIPSDMF